MLDQECHRERLKARVHRHQHERGHREPPQRRIPKRCADGVHRRYTPRRSSGVCAAVDVRAQRLHCHGRRVDNQRAGDDRGTPIADHDHRGQDEPARHRTDRCAALLDGKHQSAHARRSHPAQNLASRGGVRPVASADEHRAQSDPPRIRGEGEEECGRGEHECDLIGPHRTKPLNDSAGGGRGEHRGAEDERGVQANVAGAEAGLAGDFGCEHRDRHEAHHRRGLSEEHGCERYSDGAGRMT